MLSLYCDWKEAREIRDTLFLILCTFYFLFSHSLILLTHCSLLLRVCPFVVYFLSYCHPILHFLLLLLNTNDFISPYYTQTECQDVDQYLIDSPINAHYHGSGICLYPLGPRAACCHGDWDFITSWPLTRRDKEKKTKVRDEEGNVCTQAGGKIDCWSAEDSSCSHSGMERETGSFWRGYVVLW